MIRTDPPGRERTLARLIHSFRTRNYLNSFPNQRDDLKMILGQWTTSDARDCFLTPDTDAWWTTSDKYLAPMYTGEKSVADAMKESADHVNNDVFAKRGQ